MKISIFYAVVLAFIQFSLSAQTIIEPVSLKICCNKTTHLIFPLSIRSVDHGSPDVLVQKMKGVENVLELKGTRPKFEQTNLTVVTSEGKLYSFLLDFDPNPGALSFQFTFDSLKPSVPVKITLAVPDLLAVKRVVEKIRELPATGSIANGRLGPLRIELQGIYSFEGIIYFKLLINNQSDRIYGLGKFSFVPGHGKTNHAGNDQSLETEPLYVDQKESMPTGYTEIVLAIARDKVNCNNNRSILLLCRYDNSQKPVCIKIRKKYLDNPDINF